jgi:hypothetical protein
MHCAHTCSQPFDIHMLLMTVIRTLVCIHIQTTIFANVEYDAEFKYAQCSNKYDGDLPFVPTQQHIFYGCIYSGCTIYHATRSIT